MAQDQGHATWASSHALPGVLTPGLEAQVMEAATGAAAAAGTQAGAASQEEPTFSGRPSPSSLSGHRGRLPPRPSLPSAHHLAPLIPGKTSWGGGHVRFLHFDCNNSFFTFIKMCVL